MSSGLIITVCEAIRKPIFSEVQVVGIGSFSGMTEKIGETIESGFSERGYLTSMIGYGAMTSPDGKVIYNDKDTSQSDRHENFHVLMKEEKMSSKEFKEPAKGYLSMFNESAATAVQEYSIMLESGEDKTIQDSIKYKQKFGRDTYNLARKCLALDEITEQQINEFAGKSPAKHRTKNWASVLVDITYFGFLEPCYAIMQRNGMEKGQKELIGLTRTLKDDPTAKTFFRQLGAKSKKCMIAIPPIRQGLVNKGLFEYRADADNYIRAIFSGPRKEDGIEKCDFFTEIKKEFMARHGDELDSMGEPWMNVWAHEIIFGGWE